MRNLVVGTMAAAFGHVLIAGTDNEMRPPDPALVDTGRTVYRQYCASCHGANAQGAPNWQQRDEHGELPAPPHDAQGHTWRHSDAQLFEMVSKGLRDPFNKTRRLTMPPFGDRLSQRQIIAVITFLKTLWTPKQSRFQVEESQHNRFP